MTFATTLRLASGDRAALDGVVEDIRGTVRRKGAELEGPHSHPPERKSVPLYRAHPPADPDRAAEFGRWEYTVYRRTLTIVGHDELARRVAGREFPDSVHVEVEVETRAGPGT